ncbi:MAG: hypothetical protein U9Q94_04305 [Candidatus Bipolaricaulota bacterium]|nr:hypothetical protein [Candidatus Bipolaricaulota bacterium]
MLTRVLRVVIGTFIIIGITASLALGSGDLLTIEASKDPVSRWDYLTYKIVITNGSSPANLTVEDNLPNGLDQNNASYSIDYGDWHTLPPYGMIHLGTVDAEAQVTVQIKSRVESTAPATLTDTANLTDGSNKLASANVTVNVLPSVDAGPDMMVRLGDTSTFSDAWSGDGDGAIVSYAWEATAGGVAVGSFVDPSIIHPTYAAPAVSGPVWVTLTVMDEDSGVESDSFWLSVNSFPTANAGADRSVDEKQDVKLGDASATDSDGYIVSYQWNDGGTGGSFDDPQKLNATYATPSIDDCDGVDVTLMLTVTDNLGAPGTDEVQIHVNNVNHLPQVDAGEGQNVHPSDNVALSGTVTDADGPLADVHWEQIAGPSVSLSGESTDHATFIAPEVSSQTELRFRLTVLDNCGGSASDSVSVYVKNINVLPTANAGPNQTVQAGDWVTLAGTGSDPDGTISSFTWEQIGGPSVTLAGANTNNATFTAPAVSSPTSLQFRLTVTDNDGGSASDEVIVTVNPGVPPAEEAAIAIEKIADRESTMLGETVHYTYTVTNTGEATLSDVRATDDKLGDITLSKTTLSPGESATATASAVVQESDLPGPLTNTVTVQGMSEEGALVTSSDEASVQLSSALSSIEVVLEAQDSHGFPISPFDTLSVGEEITYVYTITNTGESILDNLALSDERLGSIPLSHTKLAPWGSLTGSFTVTITEEDLPGAFSDTVTASATDPYGKTVSASDTLILYGLSTSGDLELAKTCDTSVAAVGDVITYTYTIMNVGQTTITDLVLTDDHLGEITLPTTVIAPEETIVAYAEYTVSEDDLPGPLTNTATITGQGLAGQSTSGSTSLSIEVTEASAGGGGSVAQSLDGRVIINEIAWAGTPASPADEWIELRNLGSIPVDLSGWSLCWYRKGETVPPEEQWTRVPLTGTISPSPIDLSAPRSPGSQITFVQSSADSWRVVDISWWAAGKRDDGGHGYYLLERRSEHTVSDVTSDLLYDRSTTYKYILPDSGAVVLLIDADENVVDTANGEHMNMSGWPAGDVNTCATMERTDPLSGDLDINWHTNPGILTNGHDADGDRLIASAGKPNSPSIDDLTLLAQDTITPIQATATISVDLTGGGKPRIQVAALGLEAAGGGGASSGLSFSTHYSKKESLLTIDTTTLASGTYFVWITNGAGESTLVPLAVK